MDFDMFPWPNKGEKLFKEGGNYYEYSHIGWGDLSTQFYGYMIGYKQAADQLVDYSIASQDIRTLDTFFFPICFLYRQYLELGMKKIYLQYSEVSWEVKEKTIKHLSHDLLAVWKEIKTIIFEANNGSDSETLDIVEDYINQFHNFDKSSFIFRYPITKTLEPVLNNEKRINLRSLKERMNELYNFFSGCEAMLDNVQRYKDELRNIDF